MDPSSGVQHQQMSSQSLENMLGCSNTQQQQQQQEKKPKPQPEALKCPRCDSNNTKFCYYNNYSLTQPRYFCKSCRRYWTKGGTLRNVPVGGGCRKNKRSSSSSSSRRSQDQIFPTNPNNPLTPFSPLSYDSNDLTLALARLQKGHQIGFDEHDFSILGNPTTTTTTSSDLNNNHVINHHHHHHHHTSTNIGFLDALLGTPNNNVQNMYYGYNGNGDMGEVENGVMMIPHDQEMNIATTQAVTVTTMKQEICNAREQSQSRGVLWGFPWQLNGGDTNMGEIDSGRGNWNGLTSSWHGLLNSPLM